MKTLYINMFAPASPDDILEAAEAILTDRARGALSVLGLDAGGPYTQLRHHLRNYKNTVFGAIFVGPKSRVAAVEDIFIGTFDDGKINTHDLIRSVLKHHSKSVIFFHYHVPSAPDPTTRDLQYMRVLAALLSDYEVDVADLWILDRVRFVSLEQSGLKL